MKATKIASAKPNEHKVQVGKRTYVYGRIRKRFLSDDQCGLHLIHQVAKETLRRMHKIFNIKPNKL